MADHKYHNSENGDNNLENRTLENFPEESHLPPQKALEKSEAFFIAGIVVLPIAIGRSERPELLGKVVASYCSSTLKKRASLLEALFVSPFLSSGFSLVEKPIF